MVKHTTNKDDNVTIEDLAKEDPWDKVKKDEDVIVDVKHNIEE